MVLYIRPDADTTDGSWTNASGNNTDLYDSLNESTASDSDYIKSSNQPSADIVRLRLGNFGATVVEPMFVRYRIKSVVDGTEILSLTVRLIEGNAPGVTIAEWEHTNVTDTYTDVEQELTTLEFNDIGDFDDLYLEFQADVAAMRASFLVTGETQAWAFDATTYDAATPAAYTGGPVGGTVYCLDTGTPANNLDDVPLDTSNITQLSTSPKMVHWDSAPYVRFSPHNYALQSQTLGTSWTATAITVTGDDAAAPDGTTTADKLVESNTSTSVLRASSSITVVSGIYYSFSFYIDPSNITWIALTVADNTSDSNGVRGWFNVSSGATGTLSALGTGWTAVSSSIAAAGSFYRCTIVCKAGATTLYPSIFSATADAGTTRVTSGTYWAWGANVNRGLAASNYLVTTTAARIGVPIEWSLADEKYGIMTENGANQTNYILRSADFANASWTKTDITLTGSQAAPDGSSDASLCTEGTAGTAVLTQAYTAVNGTYRNPFTIYAKRGNTDWIRLKTYITNSTTHFTQAWFNLATLAVGTASNGGSATDAHAYITDVDGSWCRCEVYGFLSNNGTPSGHTCEVSSASADNSTTRVNNATYSVWGAQENQSQLTQRATSYTPTISATATRGFDDVRVAAISTMPTISTEVSAYFQSRRASNSGEDEPVFKLSDVTGNNNILLYHAFGTSQPRFYVVAASAVVVDQATLSTVAGDALYKMGGRVKLNDSRHGVNGTLAVADTVCAMPTGMTFMAFNNYDQSGFYDRKRYLYYMVVLPRALNDTDLDTVTTP